MADLVATTVTTLPPDEVMVRAVQFFTNQKWRAQSQTNRVATFVGVIKVPWIHLLLAIILMLCFVVPGIIYYFLVVRKMRGFRNIVVTTTSRGSGAEVVVTYPSDSQQMVNNFFAALPGTPPISA